MSKAKIIVNLITFLLLGLVVYSSWDQISLAFAELRGDGYEFQARDAYDDEQQPTLWSYKFIAENETCNEAALAEGSLTYEENTPIRRSVAQISGSGEKICFRSSFEGAAAFAEISPIAATDNSSNGFSNTAVWITGGLLIIFGLGYFYIKNIRAKSG